MENFNLHAVYTYGVTLGTGLKNFRLKISFSLRNQNNAEKIEIKS